MVVRHLVGAGRQLATSFGELGEDQRDQPVGRTQRRVTTVASTTPEDRDHPSIHVHLDTHLIAVITDPLVLVRLPPEETGAIALATTRLAYSRWRAWQGLEASWSGMARGMTDHDQDPVDHLRALATDQRVVMVTTCDSGGTPMELEGRPLTVLDVDDRGTCSFLVDGTADWIAQVRGGGPASISGADMADGTWFSASGTATLVEDRARIEELWTPIAEAWFDGKDDPRLAVLAVEVATLAWWESADNRLVRMWKLATAAVRSGRGETGEHGVDRIG